ncbi:nucleolus protein [Auriscalpium vulgare]|uniref:Nucleolus protein n=1 Tax=Auriscalpium vulgare TaxID=40419 RepID=A0ACB8RVE5_9AGAM|nr:nucleolus protein [Auriscalpium vulgare]
MPKVGRRKIPVTAVSSSAAGPSNSSTAHSSRTVIRAFHTLLKRQSHLRSQPLTLETAATLQKTEDEIQTLGGLEVYQRMSSIGQGKDRGGGAEKVLLRWLRDRRMDKGKGKQRLLEVGALKPDNYATAVAWLDVTPIDLHSRHPQILEQDFLAMSMEEHRGQWDVISLSLVVNFVPNPRDRGRMLSLAHAMLRTDGLLFVTLPLPCVMNSRYTTLDHMKSLMHTVGFSQLEERWKQGGKMAYWLYRKAEAALPGDGRFDKRRVLMSGAHRNNFVILLSLPEAE